jgi:hypothetical protein
MQGQSSYTRFKEERFVPVLSQSLRISKALSVARFPYYHIDLNAGGGFNTDVQVPGSPLNFLLAAERNGRENFFAFFVDSDPVCIRNLITRPEIEARADRIAIFQGDNSEVLPVVAEFIADKERNPHYAMGSILIDPNGYHNGVPWDALRTFCAAHPRFDLFFNLNIRSFRMERPHIRGGLGAWGTKYRLHPVAEFPAWFSRPHWMWTPICQIAGSSWMQLVGRTIQTDSVGYSRLGFYDSQSDYGRRILGDIETSRTTSELPLLQEL